MLKHIELDPIRSLEEQFSDDSNQTTILINFFDVDPKDHEAFKIAWAKDAAFFKEQPVYLRPTAPRHSGQPNGGQI